MILFVFQPSKNMKKVFIGMALISLSWALKAQNSSLEKSIFGIQTGFLGLWLHHEAKLTQQIVLRSEIGFDSGIWGGAFYEKTGFLLIPVLTAEPRWYYNLDKRMGKSKSTEGNSGNFVSLKADYHPDWFVISNYNRVETISDLIIVPTWGIRRNLGKRFNYESGIGMGCRYIFAKQAGYLKNQAEVALNLHLRIGFKF
jgi:hypothetical protein